MSLNLTAVKRERERLTWCFIPSQPLRLYQRERERGGGREGEREREREQTLEKKIKQYNGTDLCCPRAGTGLVLPVCHLGSCSCILLSPQSARVQLQKFVTAKCTRTAANVCHRKVHTCCCKRLSPQSARVQLQKFVTAKCTRAAAKKKQKKKRLAGCANHTPTLRRQMSDNAMEPWQGGQRQRDKV